MKVVILAGGKGTRISEESHLRPKPMVEIGGMPILWHIMKGYSHYGFNEFIICAGYKQDVIKDWFTQYYIHSSDITFDFTSGNEVIVHQHRVEPWKVTVVDTGLETQTGGRIKRIRPYVENSTFLMTYGDGVSDVNIPEVIKFHQEHNKLATLTMYNFGQTKGVLERDSSGSIKAFREKSTYDGNLINIGFMVLEPGVFDYISGDDMPFESEPLSNLVRDRELVGYVHQGFWQCMDTMNERTKLEKICTSGNAPWKIWEDNSDAQ
jgi:glucose-1-phosphate cytidylyltransferase